MRKNKLGIVKVDEGGFHFDDGFFLPWDEVWKEAIRRSHGTQAPSSKIMNVLKDKHNLWKMEYPRGLEGGKAPSTNLSKGSWREWYNNRKALGLVPGINEYGVEDNKDIYDKSKKVPLKKMAQQGLMYASGEDIKMITTILNDHFFKKEN